MSRFDMPISPEQILGEYREELRKRREKIKEKRFAVRRSVARRFAQEHYWLGIFLAEYDKAIETLKASKPEQPGEGPAEDGEDSDE